MDRYLIVEARNFLVSHSKPVANLSLPLMESVEESTKPSFLETNRYMYEYSMPRTFSLLKLSRLPVQAATRRPTSKKKMMLTKNQRFVILAMMLLMLLTDAATSSARFPSLKLPQHHQQQQPEARDQRQFFSTRTLTRCKLTPITYTVRVTESSMCARLVNVTGVCIVRQGRFIEEPVVMSFDDGMDGLDSLLRPTETLR